MGSQSYFGNLIGRETIKMGRYRDLPIYVEGMCYSEIALNAPDPISLLMVVSSTVKFLSLLLIVNMIRQTVLNCLPHHIRNTARTVQHAIFTVIV